MSRCRFCGSTALHTDTIRKNFSGKKAAAGAVAFGVVGAAAGFIGKDIKGYRCGNCGQFMETPLDDNTSYLIDTAIDKANKGKDLPSFEFYARSYPAIRSEVRVPVVKETIPNMENPVPAIQIIKEKDDKAKENNYVVKQTVQVMTMAAECPIWIHYYTILTKDNMDFLNYSYANISSKTVRSIYTSIQASDDTGDPLQKVQNIQQNISLVSGGEQTSEEFPLMTNAAYRVSFVVEKVAFTDDSVWRNPDCTPGDILPEVLPLEKVLSYPLRLQALYEVYREAESVEDRRYAQDLRSAILAEEISEDRALLNEKNKQRYTPVFSEKIWRCSCGAPISISQNECPVCHLSKDKAAELFSIPSLCQKRNMIVLEKATERANQITEYFNGKKYDSILSAADCATKPDDLRSIAGDLQQLGNYKMADQIAEVILRCCDEADKDKEAINQVETEKEKIEIIYSEKENKATTELSTLRDDRNVVISTMAGLGIFKHKEKARLQEKLDQINRREKELQNSWEQEKKSIDSTLQSILFKARQMRSKQSSALQAWKKEAEEIKEKARQTELEEAIEKAGGEGVFLILNTCRGCTACIKKCPEGCISGEVKKVHVIDQSRCTRCGICKETCMFDAIIVG